MRRRRSLAPSTARSSRRALVPPDVDLGLDTVVAALKIPAKTLAKRLADAEDRRVVTAMYDELVTTGRVYATLPEDDRVVQDLYAVEIEAPRLAQRAEHRAAALQVVPTSVSQAASSKAASPPPASAGSRAVAIGSAPARSSATKHYLALSDAIERAPSIGPKMADRLGPLGVTSVADFLASSPDAIASGLNTRSITPDTIALWQDQCQLMLDIPGLRGGHAELLAQSGYTTAEALAEADEASLCADVLAFAATAAGQRILREGSPPDLERIKGWLAAAKTALAA